jgi:hypothetical protein
MSFQGPVNTFTTKNQKNAVHVPSDSNGLDKVNSSLSNSSRYSTSQDDRMDSHHLKSVNPGSNIAIMTMLTSLSDEIAFLKECNAGQKLINKNLNYKFQVQKEHNERVDKIVNRLESDRTSNALANQKGHVITNSVSKQEVDHYFRITFKKDFKNALNVSKEFSTVMYFNYIDHNFFISSLKSFCLSYFLHSPYFHAEIGSQTEEQKKKMFKLLTDSNKLLAKTNVKETNGGKEIKEKGSFKQPTDRTRLDFLKIIRSMVANSCVFYTEPLCSGLFSNCKDINLDMMVEKFVTALHSAFFGSFETDTFLNEDGEMVSIVPFDNRGYDVLRITYFNFF